MAEQSARRSAAHADRRLDSAAFVLAYLVLLFALRPSLVLGPLGQLGRPALLLGLVGFGLWVLFHAQRIAPATRRRQPVRIALVLVLLAMAASYVAAMRRPIDGLETSTALAGVLSVLSVLGVALLVHDGTTTRERLESIVSWLLVAAGLEAALGLAQFATGSPLVASWPVPGLTANMGAVAEVISRDGFNRSAGTALHPIEYGAVLCMLLPLAVARARVRSRHGSNIWWGLVVLIGLGVVVALSRSALICLVVGLVVVALTWSTRARVAALVGTVAVATLVVAVVPGIAASVTTLFTTVDSDSSVASRTGSYPIALQFFEQSPFFGRGYGTFLPSYRIFDNEYLLLLVEVGAVGVLVVLGSFLTAMWAVRRARASVPDDHDWRELGQGVIASVAAGAAGLAMYDGFSFPMATGVQFLVLGIAGAYVRLTPAGATRAPGVHGAGQEDLSDVGPGRTAPGTRPRPRSLLGPPAGPGRAGRRG